MPKILNFVKKIHYYSELFTSLLSHERGCSRLKGRSAGHFAFLPASGAMPKNIPSAAMPPETPTPAAALAGFLRTPSAEPGRGTYVKIKSLGGVNMVKLNKL